MTEKASPLQTLAIWVVLIIGLWAAIVFVVWLVLLLAGVA